MEKQYRLAKMTWPEVEDRLKECDIAIVPLGATEQHGPALPVDNDHFIAEQISRMVAETLWDKIKLTVTPTISFGYSPHHMDFKGTITLQESTLTDVIVDVVDSLASHGFKKIIIINGHGGNSTAIRTALHLLHECVEAKVYSVDWWGMAMDKIRETTSRPFFHACETETSVAWHVGQRVLDDKRVDEPGRSPVPGFIEPDMFSPTPSVASAFNMKDYSDSGVVGYSTRATKEKGKAIVDVVVDRIAEFILKIR